MQLNMQYKATISAGTGNARAQAADSCAERAAVFLLPFTHEHHGFASTHKLVPLVEAFPLSTCTVLNRNFASYGV